MEVQEAASLADFNFDQKPLGTVGEISLWVGFGGMALPTLWFYYLMIMEGTGRERLFHVLTVSVTAMASMAYLFMALGQGFLWVSVDGLGYRPLFYMRYIDWLITTPILLLDLCLLASAQIEKTALLFLLDILMIIGGLLGALISGWTKYLFWGASMFAYIPIVMELLIYIPDCARKAGPQVLEIYELLARLTCILWSGYPVIWVLAEGAFIISADAESICYMVLDVVAKVGFGIALLRSHHVLKMATGGGSEADKAEEPSPSAVSAKRSEGGLTSLRRKAAALLAPKSNDYPEEHIRPQAPSIPMEISSHVGAANSNDVLLDVGGSSSGGSRMRSVAI